MIKLVKTTRRELQSMLKMYFPRTEFDGGWFYNQFFYENLPHLHFSKRKDFDKVVSATLTAVHMFGSLASEWLVFHDGFAGWRSLKKSVKWIQGVSLDDLDILIRQEFYFRNPDGFEDNYNIIDSTGQWAVVFCHHNDWYAFHRETEMIKRLKLRVKCEERLNRDMAKNSASGDKK